jgi:hypothetical protein
MHASIRCLIASILPLAMADAAAYIRARQPQPLYLA